MTSLTRSHRRSTRAGRAYDPATVKLMGEAFDATWRTVWSDGDAATIEERRTQLAMIIFAIVNRGEHDLAVIREKAVKLMRLAQRATVH